jgi:hypothetical protein
MKPEKKHKSVAQGDDRAYLIEWKWNKDTEPKRLKFTDCCRIGLFKIS